MPSPYDRKKPGKWQAVTVELLNRHPLNPLKSNELVNVVLEAWRLICNDSVIGGKLKIGVDLFPKPQVLGDFLHELVPYLLEKKYPKTWRRDVAANEKDMVHIPDDQFSVEMKTSSSASGVFGNRSFSQEGESQRGGKKLKSGYYLTINFTPMHTTKTVGPIKLIRFGWLDHSDWTGQKAATGQQASLSKDVLKYKLQTLYPAAVDDGDDSFRLQEELDKDSE